MATRHFLRAGIEEHRGLLARTCLCIVLLAGTAFTWADSSKVYQTVHAATLDPNSGHAHTSLTLVQPRQLVRSISFRMPPDRFLAVRSDSPVEISGDQVTWYPGENGGSLHYDVVIERKRKNGAADARITPNWALLKLDHLFPAATTRTIKGALADASLRLAAPDGWSIETPYGWGSGQVFPVDNPRRRFDQPRGWMMAGDLAVRREKISGRHVSVASPGGAGFRASDTLAFLRWTLPSLAEVFPSLPSRLLIVSGEEDMWRGGLSGRGSLYIHGDRPMVSGNRTSTLLHELVHVASSLHAGGGADWIVEGLAEYYSLALLKRSGGISEFRYDRALQTLEQWSADTPCTETDHSHGKRTAAAALVMSRLDNEIRSKTDGRSSLDTLVRKLVEADRNVTNAEFRTAAEALLGGPARALAECP